MRVIERFSEVSRARGLARFSTGHEPVFDAYRSALARCETLASYLESAGTEQEWSDLERPLSEAESALDAARERLYNCTIATVDGGSRQAIETGEDDPGDQS